MNITPERALELAGFIDLITPALPTPVMVQMQQISACLKSYAEILPKWQAVLDAEPVASVGWNSFGKCLLWTANGDFPPAGTQLIIKPEQPL